MGDVSSDPEGETFDDPTGEGLVLRGAAVLLSRDASAWAHVGVALTLTNGKARALPHSELVKNRSGVVNCQHLYPPFGDGGPYAVT